jgi:hypothetical protein
MQARKVALWLVCEIMLKEEELIEMEALEKIRQ